jgi:hypothetical protein
MKGGECERVPICTPYKLEKVENRVRLINEKGGSMQLNHTMREGLWDP